MRSAVSKIQRAGYADARTVEHMRIDHGGRHIRMPQKLLYCANVMIGFQQVCGKAVPEGMAADALGDARASGCIFHGSLQTAFMHVVATDGA